MSFRVSTTSFARQTLTDLGRRQEAIHEARERIATGRRINTPSDDPGQAARLRELDTARDRLVQYERNASLAESRLAIEESTLGSMGDALMRVNDLAVQAANDTNGPSERQAIALEIGGALDGLYELANVRDSSGDALFGGSRVAPDPFSPPPTGTADALYAGDDLARRVSLGTERGVATAHTGAEAFLRIPAGNGDFAISASIANTGTARIATGQVVDGAAWTGLDHTIEFTSPTSYDVIDAGGTTVLSGAAYESGTPIEFAGVRTSIEGAPAAGDIFALTAGADRDLFGRVTDLVEALNAPPGSPAAEARRDQAMQYGLTQIQGALEHVTALRAESGVRLQTVDASRDEGSALALQLDTTVASLRDADLTEAVVRLESETRSLEILQRSHARLAGLSILDHI